MRCHVFLLCGVGTIPMNCTRMAGLVQGIFSGCKITYDEETTLDEEGVVREIYVSNHGIGIRSNVTILITSKKRILRRDQLLQTKMYIQIFQKWSVDLVVEAWNTRTKNNRTNLARFVRLFFFRVLVQDISWTIIIAQSIQSVCSTLEHEHGKQCENKIIIHFIKVNADDEQIVAGHISWIGQLAPTSTTLTDTGWTATVGFV